MHCAACDLDRASASFGTSTDAGSKALIVHIVIILKAISSYITTYTRVIFQFCLPIYYTSFVFENTITLIVPYPDHMT